MQVSPPPLSSSPSPFLIKKGERRHWKKEEGGEEGEGGEGYTSVEIVCQGCKVPTTI